ncbi:MAG: Glutamate-tRNA ligase [Parcubacteria group bacterium GW2011_GWF2_38_76]|nr:MAG: Glutamate-tRNA ligase [Parcubacteria group bacterium GW2011_GWF2_38_76]HBM45903.1 glutamate--tRNA ligase [Patescibacteria group bacterium]
MSNNSKKIIARFPPSPTGWFHIGNARTALFNYFFVKKNNGELKFRIEDTDKERSKDEYTKDIIEGLKWLGINIDFSDIYRQSEHGDTYKKYIEKMISDGKAYISKEEAKEEGQRSEVIRLRNPNKKVVFEDMIRGEVAVDTTELGDFVIAKSTSEPIYHLAVVVDDFEMGVTHIVRGEDGIYNTPRQILIQEAIGAPRPVYAHMPFILNDDRSKLSKRKQGEMVSLKYYREEGYLPEAMVNFLAFMGWNPGGNEEIMSIEEIIEKFDIMRVQKAGAIFNIKKLNWINKEYIKKLPKEKILELILKRVPEEKRAHKNFEVVYPKIIQLIEERIEKFSDVTSIFNSGEFDCLLDAPKYDKILLKNITHIPKLLEIIDTIDESSFDQIGLKNAIWDFATEVGRGEVLWPMRVALSGREKSPDPFTLASILGKEETLKRLSFALGL